ncbi:hypothetical protein SAMN04487911_12836 [Arenibacter nanhaiticus]|uniref:Uncharacterized protein n=1 Tax=Arenibacter nanhaiticus TaxID=558155 RepID=A0A1M6KXL5_9FLAO|nr:hypothetical protein [Arenibacter nanhaiticus]SHJ63675.1 hypothetical protein SAMN04487911_12836 [Arenibacter nanhaiticus]
MSKKYNVLWIDDQHKDLSAVHKTATDFDIQLWPFKSMNGGCGELEANLSKYDAILLDAKFFENEDDKPGSEDTQWIYDTKDRIRDLDKSLQYFVLTGQAKTYASEEFNKAFKNVFEKGKDEDEDTLFKMLVQACQNRELTRLKHKYKKQFEICTDAYIGSKHFDRVIDIIKDVENPEKIKVAQDMLNPMRKILEALFDKLNEIGLIPDEIRKKQGSLNGSSYFLSGNNHNYEYHSELIHPMVAENIYRLLNITQDGSHDNGKKLRADEYLSLSKNHKLYKSTIYLLLDILEYMKDFLDENTDKNLNQEKWEVRKFTATIDSISGKVIEIQDSGWGVFESDDKTKTIKIPDYMMEKHKLKLDQIIKATTKPSPDGTRTYIDEIFIE